MLVISLTALHRFSWVVLSSMLCCMVVVTIIARSLAVSEWRAPASVTSPIWKNPIHKNPFLIINQTHKYTQMTHTFFVTYECTKLLWLCCMVVVTIIARSLAVSEWRAPASVTSPIWKNPINKNPFLIINQTHKYTQMNHTFLWPMNAQSCYASY